MIIAFKYRLAPNQEQANFLKRTIGCARLVYNSLLDDYKQQLQRFNENGKQGDKPNVINLPSIKDKYPFIREVDSLALANARLNLVSAFSNFFKSRKGERKGKKMGFPKPHKKSKCRWSYTTNNQGGNVKIADGHICLPKIKWIKLIEHKQFFGEIRSVTVSMERDGSFYVSILSQCEAIKKSKPISDNLRVVGLDMSYSDFVVDSENTNDDTKPKYVRQYRTNEKKRARLNRALSRKAESSNNRNKARIRLAVMDRYIANCRKDFAHKTSKFYAGNYDVVVIEDINMQDQARSGMRGHGKSANDLGWGMFKSYLKYKCEMYDTLLVVADKWFPSSKTCNHCGSVNKGLTLSDREWVCPECGAVISRDYNAACNLRDWYFKNYNTAGTAGINACGDSTSTMGETPSQVESAKQEAAKPLA